LGEKAFIHTLWKHSNSFYFKKIAYNSN